MLMNSPVLDEWLHFTVCVLCCFILQVIKAILNALQAAATGVQIPSNKGPDAVGKVSAAVAANAQAAVQRVFDHCQQVCLPLTLLTMLCFATDNTFLPAVCRHLLAALVASV